MFKYILLVSLLVITPALADEAADKADFKRLYAEFNDLYANSDAIDPIIIVAEKLYTLAPITFSKNSNNAAVTTYNLASLYDEKGGTTANADESKAFELYEEYFAIQKTLKAPIDENYMMHYLALVNDEYNSQTYRSKGKYAKNLAKIVPKIDAPDETKADIFYIIAKQRYDRRNYKDAMQYYNAAKQHYVKAFGKNHPKVGAILYWTARVNAQRKKNKDALKSFQAAIDILDKSDAENDIAMVLLSHETLIKIHSRKGDLDKATVHCLAYAYKRPEGTKGYRNPIYNIFPDLPQNAYSSKVGESVTAIVEYDVDENGYTKNITVHSSDNNTVERTAINAVKKYRYAPNIVDGKPKSMTGFQQTFTYTRSG
ncbi:MAG: TonB family protein [Emcibacteraceae bacterium]|nr:TonB family protein [Emcibacteraceae bacterium]MDG1859146.1 TonB family protein [Emcibacteraceae bacterium]